MRLGIDLDLTLRRLILVAIVMGMASGCAAPGRFLRGYAEADPSELEMLDVGGPYQHASADARGQVRFAFDGFGSLSTDGLRRSAIPWKLLVATLALDEHERLGTPLTKDAGYAVLERHGFLTPRSIANWEGPQPRLERPLGVRVGVGASRLPGRGARDRWLRMPHVSRWPPVRRGRKSHRGSVAGCPERLHGSDRSGDRRHGGARSPPWTIGMRCSLRSRSFTPDVSPREVAVMRRHVLPGVAELIQDARRRNGGPSPRSSTAARGS